MRCEVIKPTTPEADKNIGTLKLTELVDSIWHLDMPSQVILKNIMASSYFGN